MLVNGHGGASPGRLVHDVPPRLAPPVSATARNGQRSCSTLSTCQLFGPMGWKRRVKGVVNLCCPSLQTLAIRACNRARLIRIYL